MAQFGWHITVLHTHTQQLTLINSDYIQNGAHMKQHKDWRDQNCIFHLMWIKVRAKLMAGVSHHLQEESVHILCRWRIRHLNEITKWDGTDRGLGRFWKFVQFPLKKKTPKSQIPWIQMFVINAEAESKKFMNSFSEIHSERSLYAMDTKPDQNKKLLCLETGVCVRWTDFTVSRAKLQRLLYSTWN